MIDGRFVMRDGVVATVDETAVRKQAQMSADALTQRAGRIHTSSVPGRDKNCRAFGFAALLSKNIPKGRKRS